MLPARAGRMLRLSVFNIRERLGHLGGGMKVESNPGRGATIVLDIPLASISEREGEMSS